jgi:uncharacterized membrane protein
MNSIHRERGTIYIPGETRAQIVEPDIHAMDIYQKAAWLGIVAGLRAMTPAALLVWSSNNAPANIKRITGILAAGEIVADKLPSTTSRLTTGPLIGRLVVGAMSGALLSKRYRQSALQGALRGIMGATLGSFAGYFYRITAANITSIPDAIWAAIEDGVALLIGARAVGLTESDHGREQPS